MTEQITLENLYPRIERIEVGVEIVFHSSVEGDYKKSHSFRIEKNNTLDLRVRCANRDCTMKYFDLSSEIRDALLKDEDISGTKECTGYLDKESEGKGSYRCETTLAYSVRLIRPSF